MLPSLRSLFSELEEQEKAREGAKEEYHEKKRQKELKKIEMYAKKRKSTDKQEPLKDISEE